MIGPLALAEPCSSMTLVQALLPICAGVLIVLLGYVVDRWRADRKRLRPRRSSGWTLSGRLSDVVISLLPDGAIDDSSDSDAFSAAAAARGGNRAPDGVPMAAGGSGSPTHPSAATPPRSALAHVVGGHTGVVFAGDGA
ncbi:MAG: hypothetical protein ABIP33_06265 [Pseudolysinimonas sp.]